MRRKYNAFSPKALGICCKCLIFKGYDERADGNENECCLWWEMTIIPIQPMGRAGGYAYPCIRCITPNIFLREISTMASTYYPK